MDSPSNIAVVSNIAELVARAFSQNNNPQNSWDRRQFSSQPPEHLENFDENPSNVNANHHGNSNSNEQQNIDDNVIIGSNADSGTSTTTTAIGHGFLGHMLRILGMDTNKIGALAINGIIFIAQMVCFMNFIYLFGFIFFFHWMRIKCSFGFFRSVDHL